jgi:preprotein translocase subunit SecD
LGDHAHLRLGVLLAIPSLLPATSPKLARTGPSPHQSGLDLAGGSQLLLEAETQSLSGSGSRRWRTASGRSRRNNIEIADVSTVDNQLVFAVPNPAQRDQAMQIARAQAGGGGLSGQSPEWDI